MITDLYLNFYQEVLYFYWCTRKRKYK